MNPRRNGRDGSACDLGNLRERQFFLETQEKRFPVDWLQRTQSGRDSFGIFASCGREERRFEIRRRKVQARFVLSAHPMPCRRRLLLSQVIDQPGGASLQALLSATVWQAHSVRGFISRTAKLQRLKVHSVRTESGRVYSIRH